MRWIKKLPTVGSTRIREFFAILPVRHGLETRWLERVRVKEVYTSDNMNYYWEIEGFAD